MYLCIFAVGFAKSEKPASCFESYVHACVYIYVYLCMYACMFVCMYVCVFVSFCV